MSAWLSLCACLAALITANGSFISGSEEISSPLRVAQCRANCMQKFASGPERGSLCLQGPDCFMCWENCELLQSNFAVWGAMCAEKGICFPGCQQACRFHRETAKVHQTQPVIHTRGDEVIRVEGTAATWPGVPTPAGSSGRPLVYVVMGRAAGSAAWRQLVQTVDLTVRLSDPLVTLRVLAVDPDGLVTIYSPVPLRAPGPLSTTLGLAKVMQGQRKKINTEIVPTTARTPSMPGDWHIRQVSLIHQKVLVIAEVAWQPRAARAVYLVTWEVDGGGLKGNLFTDSTSVTLSLWPDTVYHIQVELVSRTTDYQTERSAPLVIDTHRAEQVAIEATFLAAAALNRDRRPHTTPSPVPKAPYTGHIPSEDLTVDHSDVRSSLHPAMSSPLLSVLVKRSDIADYTDRRQQMELLAGSGAAILLFVVVLVAVAWRCRRVQVSARVGATSIRPKKLVEEVSAVAAVGSAKERGSQRCVLAQRSQLEEHIATAAFLKAAEKCARNEVQV